MPIVFFVFKMKYMEQPVKRAPKWKCSSLMDHSINFTQIWQNLLYTQNEQK